MNSRQAGEDTPLSRIGIWKYAVRGRIAPSWVAPQKFNTFVPAGIVAGIRVFFYCKSSG